MTTTSGMPGDDTGSSSAAHKRGNPRLEEFPLKSDPACADGRVAVERFMPSRSATRIVAALALGLSVIVGLAGPRHDRGRLVGVVAGAAPASADVVPTTVPPL